jgi:hypothetical protein
LTSEQICGKQTNDVFRPKTFWRIPHLMYRVRLQTLSTQAKTKKPAGYFLPAGFGHPWPSSQIYAVAFDEEQAASFFERR